MFAKGLVIIAGAAATAVALLGYRQQRIEAMHEMATLHGDMNRSRQAIWDHQTRIAEGIEPPKLVAAIERAQLRLEPVAPGATEAINVLKTLPVKIDRPAVADIPGMTVSDPAGESADPAGPQLTGGQTGWMD